MKKLNYLLGLLLVAAIGFTSCEETEDVGPTIDLLGGEYIDVDTEVEAGATMMFKVNATAGDKNLEEFYVIKDGVNLSGYPIEISGDLYSEEVSLTAPMNAGTYVYTFKVMDKADMDDEVSVSITVATATPFNTEVTSGALFHHFWGPSQGAYDLAASTGVSWSGAASTKSIVNVDEASATFTGSWSSDPNATDDNAKGNGTMFVKANDYDYANATKEAAEAAYSTGTAGYNVTNPAVNDIYVAKLGTDYYVIKVTEIDPSYDPTGSASNLGKLTFTYWK